MKMWTVLSTTAWFAVAIPARAQAVFTDVPDNHWAAAAVKRLAQAGIIEGYAATPAPAVVKPAVHRQIMQRPHPQMKLARAARPAK